MGSTFNPPQGDARDVLNERVRRTGYHFTPKSWVATLEYQKILVSYESVNIMRIAFVENIVLKA